MHAHDFHNQHSPCRRASDAIRFAVVGFLILLGMVTYLDRACLGTLEDPIMRDLHFTPEHAKEESSYAQTAFAMAYGIFGILSAWWGDRIGTRIMLTAVVLAWSIFTMATGAAQGLVSLVAIQFCFGAAESGAWPAITRTLSRWIPFRERGRAQGIVWIGAHITVGVTPIMVHAMTSHSLPWRSIFFLFGLAGFLWAAVWYWWFRDEPAKHPQVSETELADINAGRKPVAAEEHPRGWAFWRRLLTNRNVLALCLMYLPNSFIFYFCITWFHSLNKDRGLQDPALAFFTGLPLLLSVVADVLGGATTDWAVRRFGTRWGRAGVGIASYVIAGATVLLAAFTKDAWLAATLRAGHGRQYVRPCLSLGNVPGHRRRTRRRGQRDHEYCRPDRRNDLPAAGDLSASPLQRLESQSSADWREFPALLAVLVLHRSAEESL